MDLNAKILLKFVARFILIGGSISILLSACFCDKLPTEPDDRIPFEDVQILPPLDEPIPYGTDQGNVC